MFNICRLKGRCNLAKKTTKKSTKKTAKKAAKKVTKKTTKKPTKTTTKKAASKKSAKKKPAAKKTAQKTAAKPAKKASKKTTKKTSKAVAKKTTKKKVTKKAVTKKVTKKKTTKTAATKVSTAKTTKKTSATTKKAPAAKAPAKPEAAATKDGETKPPIKKMRSRNRKKNPTDYAPPPRPLLLGPGSKLSGGPLIASTKRPKHVAEAAKVSKRTKTPFTAKQLDDYKLTLLKKRSELVGDIEHLEEEALRSNSGETQTASNAAEFGSESFEQSLNLDLAAADRKLINEIDEALKRIADRTYGLCIESHEPISKARLAELPWAKFSIETARKHDQRFTR